MTVPGMFFVMGGTLLYLNEEEGESGKFESVGDGHRVCEQALWVSRWVHRGSLQAATNSSALVLNSESFRNVSGEYCHLNAPARYAKKFVHEMCEHDIDVDDINLNFDITAIAEQSFPRADATRGRFSTGGDGPCRSLSNESYATVRDSKVSKTSRISAGMNSFSVRLFTPGSRASFHKKSLPAGSAPAAGDRHNFSSIQP